MEQDINSMKKKSKTGSKGGKLTSSQKKHKKETEEQNQLVLKAKFDQEMIVANKKRMGLAWSGGTSTVIKYCQDKDALRKILSEGLFQAFSMFTKETPENNVKIMIKDVLEQYQYEPIEAITEAINDIRKGKYKIYGLVSPFILQGAITDNLKLISIEREREHQQKKGYGDVEISKRNSGRISDHFKEKI